MPPQRRASRRRFPSAAQGRRSRWSCGLRSVSRVSWPLRVGVTRRAKCLRPYMAGSPRGSTPGTSGTRSSCSISCQQHHPELGMRPTMAHCHLGLGRLAAETDDAAKARTHLTSAAAMYRDMGMDFWVTQAEKGLGSIESNALRVEDTP